MNALKVSERHWSVLGCLAVIIAVVFLSGCASQQHAQRDASPWQYNPNTGYPAVGQSAIGD